MSIKCLCSLSRAPLIENTEREKPYSQILKSVQDFCQDAIHFEFFAAPLH